MRKRLVVTQQVTPQTAHGASCHSGPRHHHVPQLPSPAQGGCRIAQKLSHKYSLGGRSFSSDIKRPEKGALAPEGSALVLRLRFTPALALPSLVEVKLLCACGERF